MNKIPFNVMRHNDWDRAPREPISMIALGNAIFGAAAISTSSLALLYATGVAATFAISAVTSWALSALAPKPPSGVGTQGLLTNARNAAAPHEYVYGEVRKGGVVTYIESTGENNNFLHQIIVLAGHAVEEIGDIFINDEVVTFSGDLVTSAPWNSKIRIQKFDGTQTTVPADLDLESNQINANFVGNGLAYIYVRLEYDQDVFANGIPLFTAKVKGKKVFDPRTSTTAYSANAALCIRDYLVTDYGMADVGSTNDTVFSAAANVCDEELRLGTTTTAGDFVVGSLYEIATVGTTDFTAIGASANTVGVFFVATGVGTGTGVAHNAERRYEINGVISAALAPGDILQSMMTSCAGTLFWGQGKWQLRPGFYTAPTKTLTLDDLRGPISLSTRTSRRDNFNIVRGKFNDAAQRYITSDYPERRGEAFIIEDNNLENALDLELPLTTSAAMAQRLAKLTLFRGREQMSFSADFSMAAFDVQVGDIIALPLKRYGFDQIEDMPDGKEFEVLGWRFAADGDAGDLRVNLSLRETSEAAFDWNAEESAIINNNTNLPSAFTGLEVNNLTASGGGRTQGDGTFINSVILNWDAAQSAFVDNYEVEYRPVSDSNFASTTTVETSIELSPVVDSIEYIFRVRSVSVLGVKGPITSVLFTAGKDTTAPNPPSNLAVEAGYKNLTVTFDLPTNSDFNKVEVFESTTSSFAPAVSIGFTGGNRFVRTGLGNNQTRFYFVRSIDFSGNASAFVGPESATTFLVEQSDLTQDLIDTIEAAGVEPVNSLPASGDFNGQIVFLLTDNTLYRWDATGGVWSDELFTDIKDNSVTSEKLVNLAVTAAKVADNAITVSKISANAVTEAKIADGAATSAKIATSAITETKIASDAITTPKIAAGAVTAGEIAAGAIVAGKIAASAVTAGTIAAGAVVVGKIAANAVTANEIAAGAVTASEIAANAVTAEKINALAVSANKIAAGAIVTDKIAAGAIVASKIAAGAVTADKISVSELSAITAVIGTFSSASTGERVVIEDDRISVFDSSDVLRVRIGRL
jgi:hypothetical protein